jgi:hypothetical protein
MLQTRVANIPALKMGLRTYGPSDLWTLFRYFRTYGLSDLRTFGTVDLRNCGSFSKKIFPLWSCGPSDLWTFGLVDLRTYGQTPKWLTCIVKSSRPLSLIAMHDICYKIFILIFLRSKVPSQTGARTRDLRQHRSNPLIQIATHKTEWFSGQWHSVMIPKYTSRAWLYNSGELLYNKI